MLSLIKKIEDLSLNAWPSHQIEIYDGWLLRFSYFYTHRTNCVEQIGASSIPIPEKVSYCEEMYRKWGTPAIFKISPLLDPSFDSYLEKNGYLVEHRVHNMIADLGEDRTFTVTAPVETSSFISDAWIDGLFSLKGTTNAMHRQVVPSMYRAIPKETVCVSIHDGHRLAATGLGILDREYIGVYAIHVHPDYRRRHFADSIVQTILSEGRRRGAKHAYLQVVDGNDAAIRLYESLGFRRAYTDWFRVKQLQPRENH